MVFIVPYSSKLLHRRVLVAAMKAPMSFFVSTDTGEIVNRFSQDMTLVVCLLSAPEHLWAVDHDAPSGP